MDNKLELQIKLKVKDVLRYNLWVAYRSIVSKLMLILGVGLTGWLIYKVSVNTDRLDVFISQNIIWIVLAVFILIATPFKVWTITATQMQAPIFSGVSKYIFTKENIYMQVGELEDTVSWDTYIKIVETNKDFRFFVDKVQAQIFPKHNMTAEQITVLKALIKEARDEASYKLK